MATLVKSAELRIFASDADVQAKLDAIGAKMEELKVENPELVERIDTAGAQAKLAVLKGELKEVGLAADESGGKMDAAGASAAAGASKAGEGGKVLKDLALGSGVAAAGAIYMGAKFQESATQLVTGAGQSAAGLKQVEQGMLNISTQTGTSAQDVEAGMYMIESAGYHGAQGLKVLQAAAEGAKVGNAQLGDVANVVTSALNAYHLPASQAVAITNQMVATVASGKMHMEDLASSIANVLPVAASAHLSFAQVGGALATMTAQGMSAHRASMNLANMLRAIISPGSAAAKEMQALGLNANQVANNLGKQGLTGTLSEFSDAILRNTQGGNVLLGFMNKMTPAAQGIAREVLAGTISTKQLTAATDELNPEQAALLKSFTSAAAGATGLKQTYDGAMKAMVGGAIGLNVALLLGGKHAEAFAGNVKSVSDAAKHAGPDVSHWGDITSDTAFKMEKAKVSVENAGIAIGSVLLPALGKILVPLTHFAEWVTRSKLAVDILVGVMVGALGAYAVVKTVEGFNKLKDAFGQVGSGVKMMGEKLGILTAETETQTAATEEATVAQGEMDAAMDANPIGLIIAAVALLVVGFIYLWNHFKGFRDFWKDAWKDIQAVAVGAWHFIDNDLIHPLVQGFDDLVGFIRTHMKLIGEIIATVATGGIFLFVQFIVEHWNTIRSETKRLIGDVVGFFERLPGDILHAVGNLGNLLVNAGKDLVEGLLHGITSMFGSVGNIAGDLGHTLESGFKDVLHIFSPSEVMAGHGEMIPAGVVVGIERGTPAAVAAMRKLGGALSLGGATGTGGAGAGGGAPELVFSFQETGNELIDAIGRGLKGYVRDNGGGGTNSVQIAFGQAR